MYLAKWGITSSRQTMTVQWKCYPCDLEILTYNWERTVGEMWGQFTDSLYECWYLDMHGIIFQTGILLLEHSRSVLPVWQRNASFRKMNVNKIMATLALMSVWLSASEGVIFHSGISLLTAFRLWLVIDECSVEENNFEDDHEQLTPTMIAVRLAQCCHRRQCKIPILKYNMLLSWRRSSELDSS